MGNKLTVRVVPDGRSEQIVSISLNQEMGRKLPIFQDEKSSDRARYRFRWYDASSLIRSLRSVMSLRRALRV